MLPYPVNCLISLLLACCIHLINASNGPFVLNQQNCFNQNDTRYARQLLAIRNKQFRLGLIDAESRLRSRETELDYKRYVVEVALKCLDKIDVNDEALDSTLLQVSNAFKTYNATKIEESKNIVKVCTKFLVNFNNAVRDIRRWRRESSMPDDLAEQIIQTNSRQLSDVAWYVDTCRRVIDEVVKLNLVGQK